MVVAKLVRAALLLWLQLCSGVVLSQGRMMQPVPGQAALGCSRSAPCRSGCRCSRLTVRVCRQLVLQLHMMLFSEISPSILQLPPFGPEVAGLSLADSLCSATRVMCCPQCVVLDQRHAASRQCSCPPQAALWRMLPSLLWWLTFLMPAGP